MYVLPNPDNNTHSLLSNKRVMAVKTSITFLKFMSFILKFLFSFSVESILSCRFFSFFFFLWVFVSCCGVFWCRFFFLRIYSILSISISNVIVIRVAISCLILLYLNNRILLFKKFKLSHIFCLQWKAYKFI